MSLHDRSSHIAVPVSGGWLFKGWCHCDLLVFGGGPTLPEARQVLRGKLADHRGHEAAAGPGWTDH